VSAVPWLSIVTVVRNDSDALRRTVDSVSGQSLRGVEYLVLDGASTDGTAELAIRLGAEHAWMRVWSQPDAGIYDAMNTAIQRAAGRWVHFLNAGDTFVGPEEVEWLATALGRESSPWLRTPVRFVDRDGAPTRPLRPAGLDEAAFLHGRQDVFHQGSFMTRDLLIGLGGFDTGFLIAADFDLMVRAIRSGYRPVTNEHVVVHVDASGVSSQRWRESLIEVHRIRSRGRTSAGRLASGSATAWAIGTVGARRIGRRAAERLVGRERFGHWRGGTSSPSDP
jgi:glycosyltransferase involved in cell wall biosynthesis